MKRVTEERLERARRGLEWCEAYAAAERVVRWALATGKITPAQLPAIREEFRTVADFDTYVRGGWQPPDDVVTDDAALAGLAAEVDAWEAEGYQHDH